MSDQTPTPNSSLIVQYDVPELMSETTFTSLLSRIEQAVSESKSVSDEALKSERSESALQTLTEILTSFSSPTNLQDIASQGSGNTPDASYDLQRISVQTAGTVINLVEEVITAVAGDTETNIVNGLESIVSVIDEPSFIKSESIEATVVEAVGGKFSVAREARKRKKLRSESETDQVCDFSARNSTSLQGVIQNCHENGPK